MNDLNKAMALLQERSCTCVLCRGEEVLESHKRGVAPLLDFLESGKNLTGFSAADKVIGKATALLYCLLGVQAIYGSIISDAALEVLRSNGITATYEKLVPYIINRTGDGRCPMETATAHITDPKAAPDAIRDALKALRD